MGVQGAKPEGKVTATYKIDSRDVCVKEIKHEIKNYKGVEEVKTDCKAIIVTVIGKVDPAKVRNKLANITKRKVVLLSPQPKTVAAPAAAGGGGDKKPNNEKKPPKEKKKAAKPDAEKKSAAANAGTKKDDGKVTAIYRIESHCFCDGCVGRRIKNYEGVEKVTDCEGIILTVTGKVDPTEVRDRLAEKFKKKFDLISSRPCTDGGDEKQNTEEVEELISLQKKL